MNPLTQRGMPFRAIAVIAAVLLMTAVAKPWAAVVSTDEDDIVEMLDTTPAVDSASLPDLELSGRPGADAFSDVRRLLSERRFMQVLRTAEEVLEQHPDSGLAYEVMGSVYALQERPDQAAAAMHKATELEPQQSGPWGKLGIIQMAQGDAEAALMSLERAVALDADNRFAHQRLGLLYEERGETARAIEHYRKGLRGTPPGYLGVTVNLAGLLHKAGASELAVALLAPRLPLNADLPEAQLVLARALLADGDHDGAMQRFERFRELAPDAPEGPLGVAATLRADGEPQAALEILDGILTDAPDTTLAWIERGEALMALGRDAEAAEAFEAALRHGAAPVLVQLRTAAAHLARGERPQAIEIYQRLAADADVGPSVATVLSEVLLAEGRSDEGEQVLREAVAKAPENAYLRLRLGSYLASLRRYDAALPELAEALRLAPDDPTVLKAYLLAQARAGDTAGAAATARRLYDLDPGRLDHAFLLATRLQAADRAADAEGIYREILAADPSHVLALNNLADLLARRAEVDEAEQLARRANELVADNGRLLDTLGWTLYLQGKHEAAAETLGRAAELAPEVAVIHFHRGKALAALGDQAAAEQSFAEALRLDAGADWAAEARAGIGARDG